MAVDGAGIDHSKFGTGYQTEAQKSGKFVLDDDLVRYDRTSGAGGAVPVRDYDGVWPPWKGRIGLDDQSMAASGSKNSNSAAEAAAAAAAAAAEEAAAEAHGQPVATSSSANAEASSSRRPDWMCRTVKQCSACEKKEMHFPYCQPYGNKVTIECRQIDVVPVGASEAPASDASKGHSNLAKEGGANAAAKEGGLGSDAEGKGAQRRRRSLRSWYRRISTGADESRRSLDVGADDWTIWHGARNGRGQPRLFPDDATRALIKRDLVTSGDTEQHKLTPRQETYVSSYAFRGYQICGRSHSKEAGDYAEFVGINLLLSLAALYVLLMRQRDLARRHQSMLARRIGRE